MNELPLVIYGSTACEDTAIVTARLRAVSIPFTMRYVEEDAQVNSILEKYNNGSRVTPTLVFGDDNIVVAEPSLEQLEMLLGKAGYNFCTPGGTEIRGEMKHRRMPNFTLPSSSGTDLTLYKLPRRKRAVLLFVPDSKDRVGQGYVRQLTNERALFDEYNALPIPILAADMETTREWAREFARGYAALSDKNGDTKTKYAGALDLQRVEVLLVILDAFCVPRVISHADDAGGLIAPGEVTSWLRLLDYECDE
jgi:peroxiredoxin Q/BCP